MSNQISIISIFSARALRYRAALHLYESVLMGFRRELGDAQPETRKTAHDMANLYYNHGVAHYYRQRYEAALDRYGRALTVMSEHFGEEHASLAKILKNMGRVVCSCVASNDAHWSALYV
jgi:tetratricopeptide (TPR) repeat protein